MSFHVGQKVVCVDDGFGAGCGYGDEIKPQKGFVYTVAELFVLDDLPVLRLFEIKNSVRLYQQGFEEYAFAVQRFRPIQEHSTETGMAILRSLLNPTTVSCVEQQEQHGTHSPAITVSAQR